MRRAIGDALIRIGQALCSHPGVVGRVWYGRSFWGSEGRRTGMEQCVNCEKPMNRVPVR